MACRVSYNSAALAPGRQSKCASGPMSQLRIVVCVDQAASL